MRVLLIRDKRPGHQHQVEGVAMAIARLMPIFVERLELRSRKFARSKVRDLAFRIFEDDPVRLLKLLFGISLADFGRPDLVVGSGRASFIAASLIARKTGAKFIYSGYQSSYHPRHFDLMLVQSPRFCSEPKRVLTPIPSPIDHDSLRQRRVLRAMADLAGAETTLLIGGAASGYRYRDRDWRDLARLVVETNRRYGLRWSVSDSRRTPPAATQMFSKLAMEGAVSRFIEYRVAGPGSASALFAADAIVVTEDSRSMVAESLAARRPVVAVRPSGVRFSLATEEIAAMACGGGMAVIPLSTANPEQFVRTLLSISVPDTNPRDVIAAAIAPILAEVSSSPSGPAAGALQMARDRT